MKASFQAMTVRETNAFERLAESLANIGDIDPAEAERVADFYVAEKVVKLDPIDGQPKIKHGAFMDPDVIRRAADATR